MHPAHSLLPLHVHYNSGSADFEEVVVVVLTFTNENRRHALLQLLMMMCLKTKKALQLWLVRILHFSPILVE